MRKEELRRLRSLPATKEMMEKGKHIIKVKRYNWRYGKERIVKKTEYDALFRIQNLNGFIKIAMFVPAYIKKDIKTPKYEIFLNVAGEEYITRELDENGKETRWLTAMIRNLPEMADCYGITGTKFYINNDGMRTLNNLELASKNDKKGIDRLNSWMQEQKDKETKRKEEIEQKPWDDDMALIPKLPPGFVEWMRKDVAAEYFIIYEYDKNGAKTGYCSRCKKDVPISGARHNKETQCPSCKANATFKSSGKIKTLFTERYTADIVQKFNGGIVVREYCQHQSYGTKDYKNPRVITFENARTMYFDDGKIRHYSWTTYKNKYTRWCIDTYAYLYSGTQRKLYKRNISNLKKNTLLKYSAIDMWDVLPRSTARYLEIEKGNPAIEKLVRLGMFRLARGLIDQPYENKLLAENETEIAKMLRIDNSRLKRLVDMDANLYMLRWMQLEKVANTIWPDAMIKDFGKNDIQPSDFGFLDIKLSFIKIYNYVMKQSTLMDDSLQQVVRTWRDYTYMANQLKMNTKNEQIAKPKDIKKAHDDAVITSRKDNLKKKAKEIEKKWPNVNKQLQKLKKYEFESGDYSIVAPSEVLDIVIEGTILSHCVHTCDYYFDRIQNDESYLFFLRRSSQPNVPWYTLEVEPSGNIRQKRTTGDNQNPDFDKAIEFLKKWQKHFKKQLTDEEKKLGEKANQLRLENYASLRENGNKVWHGKLAGQLLADVLEKDFMEAM